MSSTRLSATARAARRRALSWLHLVGELPIKGIFFIPIDCLAGFTGTTELSVDGFEDREEAGSTEEEREERAGHPTQGPNGEQCDQSDDCEDDGNQERVIAMFGACGVLIRIHVPTQLRLAIRVKCGRLVFDQEPLGGGSDRFSDLGRSQGARLSEDIVAEIAIPRSVDADAEPSEALAAERGDH